jgi:hypothetical protein
LRRLTWQELRDVCELAGYGNPRTKGDHMTMSRDGSSRPVVIKMVRDLGDDIVQSNKRTMGLTTDQFEDLLSQVRGQKKRKKK